MGSTARGCSLYYAGVAASVTRGCGARGSGTDLDAQEGHAQRADAQLLHRRARMLHHALRRAALRTQRLGAQRRGSGGFSRARPRRSRPVGP